MELGGSVGIISQGKCHFCSPIILILIHLVGHTVVVVAFVYICHYLQDHIPISHKNQKEASLSKPAKEVI